MNSLSDIESESELEQLSIKQLKAILQKHSVKIDSFSEKSDLVSMIKKLFRDINKRT